MTTTDEDTRQEFLAPHDTALGAEQYVLGAMLLDGRCIDDVALTPAEHYAPKHEQIHDAILAVHATGARPDALLVATELHKRAQLDKVGGSAYLHALQSNVPTVANVDYYAEKVRQEYGKRQVATIGRKFVQFSAVATDLSAREVVHVARQELDALDEHLADPTQETIADTIARTLTEIEAGPLPTTPTPWPELDDLIGGYRPGALTIVAARPGDGKTIVVGQSAVHTALNGGIVFVATTEMSRDEIMRRMLSTVAQVNLSPSRLSNPDRPLSEHEWRRVRAAEARLAKATIEIDDRPVISMADIRARAKELHRRHGRIDLLAIDYLQELRLPKGNRESKRHELVGENATAAKRLAKEFHCPVLLAAQLNRAGEGGTSDSKRRPRPSDIKESGTAEQAADNVILLYKESPRATTVEMGVGKARGGESGAFDVDFYGAYSTFLSQTRTGGKP